MFQASDSNDQIILVVRSLAIQEVQWCQTKQSLRKLESCSLSVVCYISSDRAATLLISGVLMHSAGCLILFSGLCVLVVLPSAKVQEARIIQDPLFAFIPLFSCLSSPSFRFSAYDVSCWIGRADRGLFSVMGMAAGQRRPLNCQDSLWHTFVFMLGQAFVSSDANWLQSYSDVFEQHSNDRTDNCTELANDRHG